MQDIYSNSFSFFILVIDVEVVKTVTSFWLLRILVSVVTFLFIGIVLNMA